MPIDVPPIVAKTLRDLSRTLLAWGFGLAAVVAIYGGSYSQFKDTDAADSLPSGVSSALSFDDLASGAGFLHATVFGLLVPILLLVFAIIVGGRLLAGDEEAGTLDLYLAHPLSRGRLLLERCAAMVAIMLGLALMLWAEVSLLSMAGDMDVAVLDIGAACLGIALLGTCFGILAITVGAITGRRATVIACCAVAGVLTYIFNTIGPQIDGLGFVKQLSPFYHATGYEPLRNGLGVGHVLALAGATAVLVAYARYSFDRRDLNV